MSASDDDDGGTTSEEAFCGLADDTFVFPVLSMALEALGTDEREAETAAEELRERRRKRECLHGPRRRRPTGGAAAGR